MKLTPGQVRKIADLARLGISDEEIGLYARELAGILAYVEKLDEVDVDGIEPMLYPGRHEGSLREDEVRPGLERDLVLSQAPDAAEGLFRVPAVLPDLDPPEREDDPG